MIDIAIIGGGIAGLTAAWELQRRGQAVMLFEASGRLGGIVETVRLTSQTGEASFVIETGPDGWVTEKPWASELARDLGLADQLIASNDATRVTYILQEGTLVPLPDGLRMMVPAGLAALDRSPLFSDQARAAYAAEPGRAAELKASAPTQDESIASFTERHFGAEVLEKVGAPLLSGVFGGDVRSLSVRAVMPRFVQMEREHGSLILALQAMTRAGSPPAIFTSLRGGVGLLVERMAAELAPGSVHLGAAITGMQRQGKAWRLMRNGVPMAEAGHVILATPPHITNRLLMPFLGAQTELDASSCVIVMLAFETSVRLPQGFGFLVPAEEDCTLMAATFVDQKYAHRVPPGCHLLRGFFGGAAAARMAGLEDASVAAEAYAQLVRVLGPLPQPAFHVVRHWPRSLPQYAVGHLERVAALEARVRSLGGIHLLGNAWHGVGLPDVIRDARAVAGSLQHA